LNQLNKFPHLKALEELEALVERVVIHSEKLSEFQMIFKEARKRKTVPVRGIQEKLMEYRKSTGLYTPFTDYEREMLREIMDFWG